MGSKDLTPGTKVRYKPDGSIFVLDRRKAENECVLGGGWWVREGGGLADYVLDADDSEWEVV